MRAGEESDMANNRVWYVLLGLVVISGLAGLYYLQDFPVGETGVTKEKEAAREDGLPLDAHLSDSYMDDLPGLVEKKYIRVLTTLNRTNFYVAGGRLVGFEYDLLKGYEKFLNADIPDKKLQVVLEFIPVTRDELIPKLIGGYGDVAAASLTITPQRKAQVDFTDPYLSGVAEVVVARKHHDLLETVSDLSGRKVAVRKSSSYFQSLERLNSRFLRRGRPPVNIVTLSEELETEDILEMVNAGSLPLTIADNYLASAWQAVLPDLVVYEDIKLREGRRIAWMVRKNNPQLKKSLNRFLRTHKKGTLLGNIYFRRYYENARQLKDPTTSEHRKKVRTYESMIRKYADRYGFDWLLILALAFQESGLNPSRVSRAGAVGIMQIRPATAKDPHVGITDVRDVENNIHAGVKYLAFLRDRYFSAEEIRPRDRIRLALAAYNAGPARIRKVRLQAKRMGLDPDKWFRNVELAALQSIGQETVRYVSNINKYYVLYQALAQQQNGGTLLAACR
jgi:membrane-bound lytic murein transglycosylase MltF